ncbi:MAG: sulfate transporter CysZ [Tatlockia sp.]|nr:sulfate transporter CysZ [Tatlockia sp.]
MRDFLKGMIFLMLGVRHLFTPGLKRFVLLPMLFNFLLFSGLFYLLYHYAFPYSNYYIDQLPSWLHFLSGLILVIIAISFFLLFLSMFTVLFNLVAAPFNGLLAEKAQILLYETKIPSLSLTEITIRTIKRQLQFLGFFIPRFLGMVILFFVPFIHPIYPFLWFWFTAWILSIQYQDFVMDNNLISFDVMRIKIKERTMLSLGFGSFINLLSFIPVLNLITLPAAVIGGVLLYCEEHALLFKVDPQKRLSHKI